MKNIIKKMMIIILFFAVVSPHLDIKAEAARTSIKVAVNPNMPPFQYLDSSGKPVGLHVDIMDEIALQEDLIVEYVVLDKASDAIEALEKGQADVVLGILSGSNNSPILQTTNDISSAALCMLVGNEDITRVLHPDKDPRRYIVAFEWGTLSLSQLSQLNAHNNLIMGSQVQIYDMLIEKRVDAIIGVKDSMTYLLERDDANDLYTIVHNYISTVNYAMLTRKNDRALCNSLNRGINQLRASDVYEKLLSTWTTDSGVEAANAMRIKMLKYIAVFATSALIVILGISYMNHRLKKAVEEKTSEIRKRVEQLENESKLRDQLLEYSPGGIMLLKEDGSVLAMNSIICNIANIEYQKKTEQKRNIQELSVLSDIWKRTASGRVTKRDRPVIIKLGVGGKDCRLYRYQCHNINKENDKVMMIEDITSEEEEKQEMFELRKNKALSRVIAGMAHEIKNPLMSIRTFASLIPAQGRDDDFQEMFAQHVPKEIERINHLIDMLINYTRPIRTNKEHVSVNELVDDAVFFARISCKDKEKIICQSEVSVKTYIYVNKDQIRQALINLIMNSIQSMEEKLLEHEDRIEENLRMHLSAYKRQDRICIEVRDDGCGMTESEIEKCIEPFFTTKAKGLGMGLALTKQFVDENSGKLEFESIKNEFTSIRMVFEEDTKV